MRPFMTLLSTVVLAGAFLVSPALTVAPDVTVLKVRAVDPSPFLTADLLLPAVSDHEADSPRVTILSVVPNSPRGTKGLYDPVSTAVAKPFSAPGF